MKHAPFIFGFSGTILTEAEKIFFSKVKPFGFILFSRNIENPLQLMSLTQSLKEVTGDADTAILIDQEGGRVQRMKSPNWNDYPAAATLKDRKAVYSQYLKIGTELFSHGINVNCAPVLDVPTPGSHDIIGDRAFSRDPEKIITRGTACCQALLDSGVIPVIKHIPGHGRAVLDSHKALPIVDTPLSVLEETDFLPFKQISSSFYPTFLYGMTAHILYEDIDPENPATLSKKVIEVIRKNIGFEGLLMSDDIDMKALKGDRAEIAKNSLAAGCDLVLHCNGNLEEMQSIIDATGYNEVPELLKVG